MAQFNPISIPAQKIVIALTLFSAHTYREIKGTTGEERRLKTKRNKKRYQIDHDQKLLALELVGMIPTFLSTVR